MIEFGQTLRKARESKNYSISQLAEITHILPQIIENLEKEDFTRIVAPIYGRGFVKLYCEAVGLEAQPFISEFMEIYNGNRPPVIRLRESTPSSSETSANDANEPPNGDSYPNDTQSAEAASTSMLAQEETSSTSEPPMFDFNPPSEKPVYDEQPPKFNFEPLPESRQTDDKTLTHPACDPAVPFRPEPGDLTFPEDESPKLRSYQLPGHSMPNIPRSFWRFGILIAATFIILTLIFFSCRAIYRATMLVPADGNKVEERQNENKIIQKTSSAKLEADGNDPAVPNLKQKAHHAKSNAPRKPVAIPPLYID